MKQQEKTLTSVKLIEVSLLSEVEQEKTVGGDNNSFWFSYSGLPSSGGKSNLRGGDSSGGLYFDTVLGRWRRII